MSAVSETFSFSFARVTKKATTNSKCKDADVALPVFIFLLRKQDLICSEKAFLNID